MLKIGLALQITNTNIFRKNQKSDWSSERRESWWKNITFATTTPKSYSAYKKMVVKENAQSASEQRV